MNLTERSPDQADALDARITAALEAAPTVTLSVDFLMNLAAHLPARSPDPAPSERSIGRATLAVASVLLLGILCAFAAHGSTQSPLTLVVDFSFAAEFLALIVFQTLLPRRLR